MKRNISTLCLLLLSMVYFGTKAQSISNYVFATGTDASLLRTNGSLVDDIDMTSGTTVLIGGSNTTGTGSAFTPIGFDFYMNGTRQTNFGVNSNGWMLLGNIPNQTTAWLNGNGIRLAPFTGTSISVMGTSLIGRIHSKVIGTAPSRVLVVEFLNMAINASFLSDTNTFQVRLYEQTGEVEYVYGTMKCGTGAPVTFNIGFSFTTTVFTSVNPSTHTASTSTTTTYTISSNGVTTQYPITGNGTRRYYRWTPNAPNDPTNFQITAATSSTMTLTWTDASNEVLYALYRSIDGGTTYTFVNTLAANTVTTTQTGLPSGTTIYWRIYSVRESLGGPVDISGNTLPAPMITSIASGTWNNTATWSTGTVPAASDSVRISAGHTVTIDANGNAYYLVVDGTLQYSNTGNQNLTIANDVLISSTGNFNAGTGTGTFSNLIIGGTATNNSTGNLTNNGIFDMNTSAAVITQFLGSQNSTISGTGTTTDFSTITVNKGTSINSILDVNMVFTLRAPTNQAMFNINVGTMRINSALNVTAFPGAQGFTFTQSANARFWLNNATANIGTTAAAGGTFWQYLGEIRVDNGTLTIGSGSHQCFTGTNGVIRVSNGTLNINGSLTFGTAATSGLLMSGGSININPNATGQLAVGATTFTIPSAATVTWTAGTITIVNPHAAANGTAISLSAGGVKTITGGTLRIGNGVSVLASGTGSNGGFGLSGNMDLWNLEINNNTNTAPTRMARLVGDLRVVNQLEIKPNSYLFLGSGTIGSALKLASNTNIIDGTLAGTEPSGLSNIGTLSLEGTSGTQTVSGAGSFASMNIVSVQNSGAGVQFTNSTAWNTRRVNLISGNINPGSNLIIGSSSLAGTIQIGGQDELTPSGTFTSVPGFNTTSGPMSYVYGPTSSTLTTGAFNEMAAGAQNLTSFTVNDADNVTANRAITALVLNLSGGGNLVMGNNPLTLGTSATVVGSINRTSGFVVLNSGTAFTRWYSASAFTASYNNGFPILIGATERSVQLAANFATGGSVTVAPNLTTGFTTYGSSFTDGTVTVDRRTNSYWNILTNSITLASGNLSLKFIAQGVGAVTDVTALRMSKINGIAGGISVNGSGTVSLPEGNRDFNGTSIPANDTFYLSSNSSTNPLSPTFTAVANGDWTSASTWDAASVPGVGNDVLIPTGFNVALTTGTNSCASLTIGSGGTLTASGGSLSITNNIVVSGTASFSGSTVSASGTSLNGLIINTGGTVNVSSGSVTIGPTGGSNRTLSIAGSSALNVTGGTLTINGNFIASSGATFTQSAGTIVVDGNSGSAATSVSQGTHTVTLNTSAGVNCSGGTIIIVDPPFNTYSASSTNSLRIAATANTNSFSGTHTFQFGDGVSNETGNVNGFNIDTRRTGVVPVQNIVVNAGSALNRFVSTSYSGGGFGTHMKGNLTINAGSEFRHVTGGQLAIGGNIINNGTLTCQFAFTLGGIGYTITNPQSISGTGTFRNAATSPTGSFASMTIANGSGLTLSTSANTFVFTGTLDIGGNNITANNNIVRLSSTGALTRTSGYVIGTLGKNFAVGSSISRTFEIGSSTNYLPVTILVSTVSTTGNIDVSTTAGDHPQISSSCLNASKTVNRFWTISQTGIGSPVYQAQVSYLSSEVDAGVVLSNFRSQAYNGSVWQDNQTATATTTQSSTSFNGYFGDVQVGEFNSFPVSVSISAPSTTICSGTSVLFTATPTNGGSSPSYQWKRNGSNVGTNSSTWTTSTLNDGDVITCVLTSNSFCATTPTATSNSLTMTVSAPTVKGSVSGGSTICQGLTSGTLTLSGQTGSVTKWQSAPSPFTTWTDISNTSTTYTSGALSQTTAFRSVVQSGACTALNSDSTVVTVNPTTVPGSVSGGASICSGSTSGSLTLSGFTGIINKWQSSVAPFTTWTDIANTTNTYAPGSPSQTTQYRAEVQSGVCPAQTSTTATVTVDPLTVKGNVTGGSTICSGATSGTLTLSGHTGAIVKWQSAVSPYTSWTDISNTSSTYTSGALTQSTAFRAVVQSGACSPLNADSTIVTVTPATVGGSVSGGSTICSGSTSGLLTLSGSTGSIVSWESAVAPFTTWTTISNTSSTYTSGALTQTTQFRAVVQNGACASANSASTTVNVDAATIGGSVSGGATICTGSNSGTLTLSGNNGSVVRWESAVAPFSTWTTISNTSTTYTSGALTQTTQFRAVVQNGVCVSANASSTTVTVSSSSVGGSVSGGSTICSGANSGTLTLTGNTGNVVNWESSVSPFTTWTTISNTASTYTSGALTQTTQFRAVVQSGACASANSTPTTVTVTPSSVGGSVSGGGNICTGSNSGTLTLSGQVGSVINWESSVSPFTTWTTITNTASTYTSGALTQTTQFRAVVQNGGCSTATSSSTTVTVNAATVAGSISGNTPICSGSTSALTLTGSNGSVTSWESSVSPFTTWTTISNTTTSLTTSALTQATQYRANVQNGACASATTSPFTVNVTASGIWTGASSANWNDASNWCGGVPTASTNVTINSGTPNSPQVNTTAVANDLTINSGASLSFTGTSNSIDIRGNLTLNGTFNPANGTVIMGGSAAQTIPGASYTNLTITGGGAKTLSGNASVSGTFTLTLGTVSLGANNLTIGSTGSISGGNGSAFVVTDGAGKLIQQNIGTGGRTGNIDFPVGTSTTSYNPLVINNTGTSDNIDVRVINQVNTAYTGETPSGTVLTANAVSKTWYINEAVAGGSNLGVTFYWNGSDELSGYTRTPTTVARYTGSAWAGLNTANAVGSGFYSMNASGITALGIFGIGSVGSPLPVEFVSVNAILSGADVAVKWTTASEVNNQKFEVERSIDGVVFETIHTQKGAGNSNNVIDYNYIDVQPVFNNSGALYYRIKQTDFNGEYSYSKMVPVSKTVSRIESVSVYPNPFTGVFGVEAVLKADANATIELTDAVGKKVWQKNSSLLAGKNTIDIDGTNLNAGVYFLTISGDGISQHIRMIKE